jgi:hypothetical protein
LESESWAAKDLLAGPGHRHARRWQIWLWYARPTEATHSLIYHSFGPRVQRPGVHAFHGCRSFRAEGVTGRHTACYTGCTVHDCTLDQQKTVSTCFAPTHKSSARGPSPLDINALPIEWRGFEWTGDGNACLSANCNFLLLYRSGSGTFFDMWLLIKKKKTGIMESSRFSLCRLFHPKSVDHVRCGVVRDGLSAVPGICFGSPATRACRQK